MGEGRHHDARTRPTDPVLRANLVEVTGLLQQAWVGTPLQFPQRPEQRRRDMAFEKVRRGITGGDDTELLAAQARRPGQYRQDHPRAQSR